MQGNLSAEITFGVIRAIPRYLDADYDALGITPEDFELAAQQELWHVTQRYRVVRVLNACMFGTLEQLGLPTITVPSEYVASIIGIIVSPANSMAACIWLSQERLTGSAALEMSARGQTAQQVDPTSADALFALVLCVRNAEFSSEVRANLFRKLGARAALAQETGNA